MNDEPNSDAKQPEATPATGMLSQAEPVSEDPQSEVPFVAGADHPKRERVIAAIKTCYDPEIPVDIFELGLIYKVEIEDETFAYVEMTLTTPMCPVAGSLPIEVEQKIKDVDGIDDARVEVVWDPPWDQARMSEVARLELGMEL